MENVYVQHGGQRGSEKKNILYLVLSPLLNRNLQGVSKSSTVGLPGIPLTSKPLSVNVALERPADAR